MKQQIHSTAIVSPKAVLGEGVVIGPFSIIHDHVTIGDHSRIDGYCEIGYPTNLSEDKMLVIGAGSLIRSYSVFYEGSVLGPGLVTGHRVMVREKTKVGSCFQIGTQSTIEGNCIIGHHVRTQNSVTIGPKSMVGNFVWLFPGVLLTNDPNPPSHNIIGPVLEDYVVVASKATLLPGVRIGKGSFVAAHAVVGQDVPADSLVSGSPARRMCKASDMRMKDDPRQKAYPWINRFHRGYPESIVSAWMEGKDEFSFSDMGVPE